LALCDPSATQVPARAGRVGKWQDPRSGAAVTGRTVSPPLFEFLELLGHEKSLARLGKTLSSMS
jgi:glutamyl/glutaminyl-tRNA synthetase